MMMDTPREPTATAHIITTVIGSDVLSLPWCVAHLGWIGGPISLLFFSFVTWFTSTSLSRLLQVSRSCFWNPKLHIPARCGIRIMLCGLTQNATTVGTVIAYMITASISMAEMQKSNCYHKNGHGASCGGSTNTYIIIFGVSQIVLSQIPNIHKLSWLSFVAAIMSFSYSLVGVALSIAKIISSEFCIYEDLFHLCYLTAYSACNEFVLCGCLGYAAFGNNAPGNMLTGFGFYEHYLLIDFANACIVVHLLGVVQVLSQPLFAAVETWSTRKWSNSKFIIAEHTTYKVILFEPWTRLKCILKFFFRCVLKSANRRLGSQHSALFQAFSLVISTVCL